MSAGGNLVGNVGGGGRKEKYEGKSYLLVEAVVSSSVPGLWGGVDSGVYDGPLQAPAR